MIRIKRHKLKMLKTLKYTLYSLIVLSCACATQNASAQTYNATSTEDVAIAFYKTGGVIPNFEEWIKENAPYINTPASRREEIFDAEMLRLQQAYLEFNPKDDFIIVRTTSKIALEEIKDPLQKDPSTYQAKAVFTEAPDALYFPYDFRGERIVVMPYNLTKLMQDNITKSQYDYIKSKPRAKRSLSTVIRMVPAESDFTQPYKIDGIDQWVFKTRIASIEYWDSDNNLIWEHTSNWYTSKDIQAVKELYDIRPYGEKKGNMKPTNNLPK